MVVEEKMVSRWVKNTSHHTLFDTVMAVLLLGRDCTYTQVMIMFNHVFVSRHRDHKGEERPNQQKETDGYGMQKQL